MVFSNVFSALNWSDGRRRTRTRKSVCETTQTRRRGLPGDVICRVKPRELRPLRATDTTPSSVNRQHAAAVTQCRSRESSSSPSWRSKLIDGRPSKSRTGRREAGPPVKTSCRIVRQVQTHTEREIGDLLLLSTGQATADRL